MAEVEYLSVLDYRQSYELPLGFTVEFFLDDGVFQCAWAPDMPTGLREELLEPYRAARAEFLASLSTPVMVVEI